MNDEMTDEPTDVNWYSEDTATFGDRLAGAREAMGIGRTDLAERMGVKQKTISAWEEDLSEPRANKLQMLAGVLNVSLVWLLTGEGDGVAPPDEELAISPDVQKTLTELHALRMQFMRSADKLGRLEKRLRKQIKAGAL